MKKTQLKRQLTQLEYASIFLSFILDALNDQEDQQTIIRITAELEAEIAMKRLRINNQIHELTTHN